MWLPKDERKTLSFYYQMTDAGSINYSYKSDETQSANKHQMPVETVKQINKRLRSLGLINTQIIDAREIKIELTPEGLQLGQKYNSRWSCIKLWYDEYIKGHPIWLIISFILGVLVTVLVNWLSSFFGAK